MDLSNVVLEESSIVLGEGKGFYMAQSRLGPGRIHHCMRAVGLAARCYELMLQRSNNNIILVIFFPPQGCFSLRPQLSSEGRRESSRKHC